MLIRINMSEEYFGAKCNLKTGFYCLCLPFNMFWLSKYLSRNKLNLLVKPKNINVIIFSQSKVIDTIPNLNTQTGFDLNFGLKVPLPLPSSRDRHRGDGSTVDEFPPTSLLRLSGGFGWRDPRRHYPGPVQPVVVFSRSNPSVSGTPPRPGSRHDANVCFTPTIRVPSFTLTVEEIPGSVTTSVMWVGRLPRSKVTETSSETHSGKPQWRGPRWGVTSLRTRTVKTTDGPRVVGGVGPDGARGPVTPLQTPL